jgi:hypothetical protein
MEQMRRQYNYYQLIEKNKQEILSNRDQIDEKVDRKLIHGSRHSDRVGANALRFIKYRRQRFL